MRRGDLAIGGSGCRAWGGSDSGSHISGRSVLLSNAHLVAPYATNSVKVN